MATAKMYSGPRSQKNFSSMGRSPFNHFVAIALCCGALIYPVHAQEKPRTDPTFANDIYPLFQERCAKCHTKKTRGKFSVNSREAVLEGGKSGKVVVPGESENSLLYKMVVRQEGVKPMPRKRDPLNDKEVEQIKRWIDQGAK